MANIASVIGGISSGVNAATPLVRSAALGTARRLGGMGLTAAFGNNNPATREIYYQVNSLQPNLIADPGDIIDLIHAGELHPNEAARQLSYLGIDVTSDDGISEVWRRLIELHRPSFDLELYKKWYRQGRMNWDQLSHQLRRAGISVPSHANLWLNDYELLPEPVIREQYLLGHWSLEQAIEALRKLGFRQPDAERIANAWTVRLSPVDVLNLKHRGVINTEQVHEYLRASGITREVDRNRIIQLGQLVPTPSDAVLFAVHDVFEPELVGRAQATIEYGQQRGLKELFRATGIGDVFIDGISPETGNVIDAGLLYWLAHYRHVSPQQVYEMYHRLRPNRVHKFALPGQNPAEVQGMITDLATVRRLLKLDDYNPYWRDRLAAIAYRTIGRVDVRRMYALGVFGVPQGRQGFAQVNGQWQAIGQAERETVESYLDMGYSPPDATNLALFTASQSDNASFSRIRTTMKSVVCQAVETGIGTNAQNIQILTDVGLPPLEAEAVVTACDIRRAVNHTKRAVKLIRRAYLGGRIPEETAIARLNQLSITQSAITRYIDEWNLDLTSRAKEPQAAQLCEWYGAGLLSLQEFNLRLLRLGWSQADATRILNHCLGGIAARTVKEKERMANIAKRNAKEKLSEERYALRRFLSGRQDLYIVQWFKEGTITLEDVRQTLVLRGWSKADVERFICSLTGNLDACKEEKEAEETNDDSTSESNGTS